MKTHFAWNLCPLILRIDITYEECSPQISKLFTLTSKYHMPENAESLRCHSLLNPHPSPHPTLLSAKEWNSSVKHEFVVELSHDWRETAWKIWGVVGTSLPTTCMHLEHQGSSELGWAWPFPWPSPLISPLLPIGDNIYRFKSMSEKEFKRAYHLQC